MNQEEIKQSVARLRRLTGKTVHNLRLEKEADMIESLSNQLADCQRELDAERERRFEGNRISSEEHAAELAALKAEPSSERTKQLEDSIAAFFDSEIPKGNALAQEMCMIGRKYRSQQDRIYKLESALTEARDLIMQINGRRYEFIDKVLK